MAPEVEKLLYSRRDAASALSLSVRSIDYLICTGRIPTRRVGGKILIHVTDVRRFAKTDHPSFVRVPPRNSEQASENRKSA
jgi:excisionase family DNA binding protein